MFGFTNEIIKFNDIDFKVLDTKSVDFSNAKIGIKKTITKVLRANDGEIIQTKNAKGKIESITIANSGDAIFCNNDDDKYIPSSSGKTWKFDDLQSYGYDIVESQMGYVFVKSNNQALLLVGVINQPTCIKNAFGIGKHQFLYSGATLKKDIKTGQITGIDQSAFESTWQIL